MVKINPKQSQLLHVYYLYEKLSKKISQQGQRWASIKLSVYLNINKEVLHVTILKEAVCAVLI